MKRVVLAAALALGGNQAQADTNLLVNGGFESPYISYVALGPGSTYIQGWTTVLSGVEFFDATAWGGGAPGAGKMVNNLANYVYLTSGGLEQTIATVAGQEYDLTFYAGNTLSSGRDGTGIVKLTIDGVTTDYATAVATTGAMAWKEITHSFVAASASTTVRFWNDQNPFAHFAIIDGIGAAPAAPVPEPGTWAMLLGGLGLLALARRR